MSNPTTPPRSRSRRLDHAIARLTLWWFVGAEPRSHRERAQGTVEYALVLLGAAAVALALVAWVTRSDAISRLFDAIVGRILSQA